VGVISYLFHRHQGNTESASVKSEVLETMGVPYKRFEALPVLSVSSKHVEARRIAAEYFFSHWPGLAWRHRV
jgi:hypothetical protein